MIFCASNTTERAPVSFRVMCKTSFTKWMILQCKKRVQICKLRIESSLLVIQTMSKLKGILPFAIYRDQSNLLFFVYLNDIWARKHHVL